MQRRTKLSRKQKILMRTMFFACNDFTVSLYYTGTRFSCSDRRRNRLMKKSFFENIYLLHLQIIMFIGLPSP